MPLMPLMPAVTAAAALAAALQPVPADPLAKPRTATLEAVAETGPQAAVAGEQMAMKALPDDRMTLPVTIGAAGPFRFIVDTGADGSAVSRQLAERLSLPAGRRTTVHSVAGSVSVATAAVDGLKVASRAIPALQAPLLDAGHVGADGILGTDVLRSALLHFDFRRNLLTLLPNARAARRLEGGDTIVVEARRRLGRLIVTEARLDGQRLTVVLDTGSEVTIGNEALRRALAQKGRLTGSIPLQLRSVTGGTLEATVMQARELTIGNVGFSDLGIAFADAHTFRAMGLTDRPALLLGMNALKAFDSVTVDMASKRLRFARPVTAELRRPLNSQPRERS